MGEKASMWNLWHGCHKLSEGCRHCYVYRTDGKYGKDSSVVTKTEKFDLPLQRKKNGTYKIPSGNLVYTCFTSDFLIEDADEWRAEAWEMMRIRQDLRFLFITKRIDRLQQCLPPDWGDGYDNVTICCTMENQDRVDYRLPIYKEIPIKHKIIICEPLLSRINTTTVADDTFITDTLVFTAMTFIILDRTKNALAEQTITFGFVRTVINGFRLQNFTTRIL